MPTWSRTIGLPTVANLQAKLDAAFGVLGVPVTHARPAARVG